MKGYGSVALVLLLALASPGARAGGVLLVTDAEAEREASYAATAQEELVARSAVPGAPLIEVRSPGTLDGLKAPFPIRLQFRALEGAQVLPSSFRVFYGLLKLDITDRVVQRVRVEASGVAIEQADIPAGSHRLLLQIRDSKDRVGETALSFKVAR